MRIAIPVYQGVDLLDVTGPYEMFSWVSAEFAFETLVVSTDGAPVTTVNGLTIAAQAAFADVPEADIIWVPGGDPAELVRMMTDPEETYLSYLRKLAVNAQRICSVCEGALLLAQAGLLDGFKATTHWAFVGCLKRFPKIAVDEERRRFVSDGNRLTGGGISSGLDEALELIRQLAGQAEAERVQVTTQYFPDPPVLGSMPIDIPSCGMRF